MLCSCPVEHSIEREFGMVDRVTSRIPLGHGLQIPVVEQPGGVVVDVQMAAELPR